MSTTSDHAPDTTNAAAAVAAAVLAAVTAAAATSRFAAVAAVPVSGSGCLGVPQRAIELIVGPGANAAQATDDNPKLSRELPFPGEGKGAGIG